jgi:hypothetical protein
MLTSATDRYLELRRVLGHKLEGFSGSLRRRPGAARSGVGA